MAVSTPCGMTVMRESGSPLRRKPLRDHWLGVNMFTATSPHSGLRVERMAVMQVLISVVPNTQVAGTLPDAPAGAAFRLSG